MTDATDTTHVADDAVTRPSRSTLVLVGVPVVIALVVASFVLWSRGEPARQGGYCTNATLAVTDLLDASGSSLEVLLQPVEGDKGEAATLAPALASLDVARLQVDTPADVAPAVAVLAREVPRLGAGAPPDEVTQAFTAVLTDYHRRCLFQG